MLDGPRVRLVPVQREHLPAFVRWLTSPEITRFLNWYRPINVEGQEKWFSQVTDDVNNPHFSIVVKQEDGRDGVLVGNCAIRTAWKDRVGNVGIVIGDPRCWGKGFGTEALDLLVRYGFDTMNLHRMELETFAFNERARASYRKVGFVEEGRKRQAHFIEGGYHDIVVMGLLEDEWRARWPGTP